MRGRGRAWVGGQLDLRPKEFDLLAYLVNGARSSRASEQIMSECRTNTGGGRRRRWTSTWRPFDANSVSATMKPAASQRCAAWVTGSRGGGRRILFAIVGVAAFAVVAFGGPLGWTIRRIEHDDALAMLKREAARAALEVRPSATVTASSSHGGASGVSVGGVRSRWYTRRKMVLTTPTGRTAAALQGRLAEYSDASTIAVGLAIDEQRADVRCHPRRVPERKFEHRVHVIFGS